MKERKPLTRHPASVLCGYLVVLAFGVLCGTESTFPQAPPQQGAETLPDVAKPQPRFLYPRIAQLKKYQASTGTGYESRYILSPSSFTAHGLQCPLCLPFPDVLRTRYTLPAFGAKLTWHLASDRVEVFSLFGGINAIKPDSYIWDVQRPRGTSFNDAWLLQGITGVRIAVDPNRHFSIGGSAGYLENYGDGKRHWNSYS